MIMWLSRKLLLATHDEQLAGQGGALGVREEGVLARALAGSQNQTSRGAADIADMAAAYAIAIAHNHPFLDGNKRTAYVALETFLGLNGCAFLVSDAEAVVATLAMASGEMADEEFTDWVRANTQHPGMTPPALTD